MAQPPKKYVKHLSLVAEEDLYDEIKATSTKLERSDGSVIRALLRLGLERYYATGRLPQDE